MNYLAHLFLASDKGNARLGGLLADFVRGDAKQQYSADIQFEIEMHKLINAYTDSHPVVLEPHPAIEDFYQELSSVHPEIDNVPENKFGDFDFSPWSVAHDRSDCHILMACVWSHADYVHDLVLKLAKKHGLAVFDPQLTKIHYP